MSEAEDEDSRTRMLCKKRTHENVSLYDLVTDSDSDTSDEEPAHKRMKQTSDATPKLPSLSIEKGRPLFVGNLACSATEEDVVELAPKSEASPASDASKTRPVSPPLHSEDGALEFASVESGAISEDPVTIESKPSTSRPAIEQSQKGVAKEKALKAIAQGRRTWIGRLKADATYEQILRLCQGFQVESIHLPRNPLGTTGMGYGYVCFSSAAEATQAIKALHGTKLDGRSIELRLCAKLGSTLDSDNADYLEIATYSNQDAKKRVCRVDRHGHAVLRDRIRPLSLREIWGDEYVIAYGTAKKFRHTLPITIPNKQLRYMNDGIEICLPDMVIDGFPLSADKLSLEIFIPLLLRANPEHASTLFQRGDMVINAYQTCARIVYRHVRCWRKEVLSKLETIDAESMYVLLANGTASVMPDVLTETLQQGTLNDAMTKAISEALKLHSGPSIDAQKSELTGLGAALTSQPLNGNNTELSTIIEPFSPDTVRLFTTADKRLCSEIEHKIRSFVSNAKERQIRFPSRPLEIRQFIYYLAHDFGLEVDLGTPVPKQYVFVSKPGKFVYAPKQTLRKFLKETALKCAPQTSNGLQAKQESLQSQHPSDQAEDTLIRISTPDDKPEQSSASHSATDRTPSHSTGDTKMSHSTADEEIPPHSTVDGKTSHSDGKTAHSNAYENIPPSTVDRKISHSTADEKTTHSTADDKTPHATVDEKTSQSIADGNSEAQTKYFPPSNISTSSPRCLNCGRTEHFTCGLIACMSCGENEAHYTWACPRVVRCQKCREPGHLTYDCPEKLIRSGGERTRCDHCGSASHVETACPDLWRTYRSLDSVKKVCDLRINCFSCGSESHFGVDCGLQPRNRRWQSLSFSMHTAKLYIDPNSKDRSLSAIKDFSIKGSSKKRPRDFSIKGRAKIGANNHESGSDGEDFLRPPVKKMNLGSGNIQIANRNTEAYSVPPPPLVSRIHSRDPMPPVHQNRLDRDSKLFKRAASPPSCPVYRGNHDEERTYGRHDYHDEYNTYRLPDRYEP